MGGSSSTTTNEPWKPVQDPLKDIYKVTDNLWESGTGPQVFPGDTLAPWSQPTQAGVVGATNEATSGRGLGGLLNNQFGQAAANGGYNRDMYSAGQGFEELSAGAGNLDPSRLFGIGGQAMNDPIRGQINQIGQTGGTNYMKQYTEDMATRGPEGSNPYFQQQLDHQLENVGNKVAGYMSGAGRYGSGAMGSAMADQMGGVAAGALSNQYNADANRRLQAASGIQGASDQGISNQFNANAQDLARNQQGLAAEQAGLNVQDANVNRQFQATDKLAGLGQAGMGNLQAFGQIAPGVDDLRYADSDRLLKIGDKVEGYQQQIMDDAKKRFDEQNQLPWQYADMMQQVLQPGMVRFGSSKTEEPFNPMSLLGAPLALAGGK